MKRRRQQTPEARLNWRDAAMPVLRDYRFGNGERKTVIDPDYERRYREMLVETSTNPEWNNDPTYDLKRKRR